MIRRRRRRRRVSRRRVETTSGRRRGNLLSSRLLLLLPLLLMESVLLELSLEVESFLRIRCLAVFVVAVIVTNDESVGVEVVRGDRSHSRGGRR